MRLATAGLGRPNASAPPGVGCPPLGGGLPLSSASAFGGLVAIAARAAARSRLRWTWALLGRCRSPTCSGRRPAAGPRLRPSRPLAALACGACWHGEVARARRRGGARGARGDRAAALRLRAWRAPGGGATAGRRLPRQARLRDRHRPRTAAPARGALRQLATASTRLVARRHRLGKTVTQAAIAQAYVLRRACR